MTNQYQLRFTQDKLLTEFNLAEFKAIATQLEDIARATKGTIDSKVNCYSKWGLNRESKATIPPMDVQDGRTEVNMSFTIPNLNSHSWYHSLKLKLCITTPQNNDNFLISLTQGIENKKTLAFYGQELDEKTYTAIMNKFCHTNLLGRLNLIAPRPSLGSIITSYK
jgi:hypothetical protein